MFYQQQQLIKIYKMKTSIFTFLLLLATAAGYSQTTYYWVGGTTPTSFTANSSWNTQLDGSGTTRTASDPTDILIFDGSNVGGSSNVTGAVTAIASSTAMGRLVFQGNVDVTFTRTSSGTATVTIGDNPSDDDLVVMAGSKLRMSGTAGSVLFVLKSNAGSNNIPAATTSATALIQGEVIMEEATSSSTAQNRFTSRLKNAFVFASGSKLTTLAAYQYYPFGSAGSSTTPVADGVIFESGSAYYFNGGLSPFGANSSSYHVNFKPGSNFYFRVAPAVNMFSGRVYGNVIIQNNINVIADGSLTKIENLTVENGSTFTAHTSGTTPVNGNIINNGTITVPSANPDRKNKLVMIGTTQSIGGTGNYNLSDFVVSDVSTTTLNRTINVDSSIIIIGRLNPNGNAINGAATITTKSVATTSVSGNVNVDSFLVKNVSDFTGVEIGMSVSGTGIPAGTVIGNLSSTAGTITLSKAATAGTYGAAASTLAVFNGAGVVLPIKFSNVSAFVKDNKGVVEWKIAIESGIIKYIVERSENGVQFKEIGSVTASNVSTYNFTDVTPFAGNNLYRVKAVGKDGEVKYSSIVQLRFTKGAIALQVFPNPVVDVLSISGLQPKDNISIIDMKGNVLLQVQNTQASNSTTMSTATFAKGNYVIKIVGESGVRSIAFVKQ